MLYGQAGVKFQPDTPFSPTFLITPDLFVILSSARSVCRITFIILSFPISSICQIALIILSCPPAGLHLLSLPLQPSPLPNHMNFLYKQSHPQPFQPWLMIGNSTGKLCHLLLQPFLCRFLLLCIQTISGEGGTEHIPFLTTDPFRLKLPDPLIDPLRNDYREHTIYTDPLLLRKCQRVFEAYS